MFKINRRNNNISKKPITYRTANQFKKNQQSLNKALLNKSYKDFEKQLNNLSIQKINSYKRLTKQNIKELQLKRSNARKDFNNALNDAAEKQQMSNNQLVYKNSILPPIPKYIPNSSKHTQTKDDIIAIHNNRDIHKQQENIKQNNNDIDKLPKRVIETQEDMANLFNQIMNGTGQIPIINQNGQIEYKEQNIEKNNQHKENQIKQQQKIITIEDIQDKIPTLLQQLESKILSNKHINYLRYIELIIELKNKFQKNSMIKSIIHKAIQKLNNQQFFKIPSDKLKELIQIVYKQLV